MAEQIKIQTPFTEEMSHKLHAGDAVLISGTIIAARDAAHKVMTEALARGEELPVDWTNQMVYYLGPTPAKPGDPIGSCGPTTSGRMDAYTPTMLEQGIKGSTVRHRLTQGGQTGGQQVITLHQGKAGQQAAAQGAEHRVVAFLRPRQTMPTGLMARPFTVKRAATRQAHPVGGVEQVFGQPLPFVAGIVVTHGNHQADL